MERERERESGSLLGSRMMLLVVLLWSRLMTMMMLMIMMLLLVVAGLLVVWGWFFGEHCEDDIAVCFFVGFGWMAAFSWLVV